MSSVYSSSLNKKNLKLKNIIFMSPLSRTKLNIPNIITDTKRLFTSNGNNKIDSVNLSYYKNKSNDILYKIYRSYSTNRNLQSHNSNSKKKNNNKKSSIKKISTSVNSSLKISSFSKFSSSLNKINKIPNQKKNSFKFPINQFLSRKKNYSDDKKIRKRNFNEMKTSSNSSFSSNFFNQKFSNSSKKHNKYKPKLYKRNKTFFTSNNSLSSENFSAISSTSVNNIKIYYNGFLQKKKNNNNINNNNNNNKKNKIEKSIQSQSNVISTSQSTLTKKKTKSLNTNTNLSNENDVIIIKNIDTPEELHFLYINILQNGKNIEGKFEVSSSINN